MKVGSSISESKIFYLFLCLASMNFFESCSIIVLLIGLWFLFNANFKVPKSIPFICLVIFSLSIIFSTVYFGWSYTYIIKSLNYPLIFIVGMYGYRYAVNKEEFIKKIIFSLFLGLLIQLGLDYLYNMNRVFTYSRRYYSIWTGEYVAVTLIGLLSSGIIGYSFYGIFINRNKFIKLLSIIGVILTIVINLFTATRTPIVLLVICYILMTIICLLSSDINKKFKIVMAILILLFIYFVLYPNNILGIKIYIEDSALFARMSESGIESSRSDLLIKFFKGMFIYPFGGRKMSELIGKLPHNFIQEAADAFGIVTFIVLAIFFFGFLFDLWKIVIMKEKRDYHYLIISFSSTLFIQSALEPIISGYPMIIWSLILVYGMMKSILIDKQGDTHESYSN